MGVVEPELLLQAGSPKSPAIAIELVPRPRTHFVLKFMMSSYQEVKVKGRDVTAARKIARTSAIFLVRSSH